MADLGMKYKASLLLTTEIDPNVSDKRGTALQP